MDIGRVRRIGVRIIRATRSRPDTLMPRIHSGEDRKSTRLNSSHMSSSYAVCCLKNKNPPAGVSFVVFGLGGLQWISAVKDILVLREAFIFFFESADFTFLQYHLIISFPAVITPL